MELKEIERKAEQILKDNDISSLPIDVLDLSIKMGVRVEAIDFENDDVSGIFILKNDKPYIGYNKDQGKNRVRFTIAHELGHYILHSENQQLFIDKSKKVMYRDANSSTGELLLEREANSFAASRLMPEFMIEKELINTPQNNSDKDTIEQLAEKFSVSTQALSFRLSNLGYDFGLF